MQEEENTPEDVIPTETPAADTPAPDTLSGSDTSFEVSPEASRGVDAELTVTGISW